MPVILARLLLETQPNRLLFFLELPIVYWVAAGDSDNGVRGHDCLQRAEHNRLTYMILFSFINIRYFSFVKQICIDIFYIQ
jgi:hypothetical protein